ncbi:MAG: glutamate--tRNA ligase [Gammaproteobacteria bacterium]
MAVKTRFAPSPTGYLHIGGVRTALFSWLYARHHQGKFVLRIEDTDRERSTQTSVDAILRGMEWLGLDHDEGPFYQTQRFDRYKQVIERLLAEDKAYRCYCTKEELDALRLEQQKNKQKPKYDGRYRDYTGKVPNNIDPVIRFKNPLDGAVVIQDQVLGEIVINNSELDDLIIARSDGTPTYNLTVVVDDLDMNITHIIRGDDHVNNTPRQINMIEALDGTLPNYAHLPMILGNDGKRMSKRHGAVSVSAYEDEGYLPDALLNYLVRLGWAHGDQEIFSKQEMISLFALEKVNKSAAAFDIDKLQWLNQQYIKQSPYEKLSSWVELAFSKKNIQPSSTEQLNKVVELQKDRVKTLSEMADSSEYFFADFENYDEKSANKHFKQTSLPILQSIRAKLDVIHDWNAQNIQQCINHYSEESELKLGKIAPPIRVAVCGSANSPSIDITLELIGKERVLTRIDNAIAYISTLVEGS